MAKKPESKFNPVVIDSSENQLDSNIRYASSKIGQTIDRLSPSEDPIPAEISHYTTIGCVQGIVQNQVLIAGNFGFLNDAKHLAGGRAYAQEMIDTVERKSGADAPAELFAAFREAVDELDVIDTYAFAFCEQPTQLTAWQHYGKGAVGVALTFDSAALESEVEPGCRLERVVYGSETPAIILRIIVTELVDIYGKWTGKIDQIKLIDLIRAEFSMWLENYLPQFKDEGFAGEREVRLVIDSAADLDLEKLNFRMREGRLVPFVRIKPPRGGKLPLKSIHIGPSPEPRLWQRSLELLLKKVGYKDVEVTASDMPYRV